MATGKLMIDETFESRGTKRQRSEDPTTPIPRNMIKRMLMGDYCKIHIGKEVYVVANMFRGETLIHVRTYGKREDGSTYPTKKGIALNITRWKRLEDRCSKDIDGAIEKVKKGEHVHMKFHLGGNIYASINSGYACVNIRRWYMPKDEDGDLVPTRQGIALNFEQWDKLKDSMLLLPEFIGDELDDVRLCEDSHQNQMGMTDCFDCNPNQDIV
nr:PC4 [Argopecten irradians irradians]